MLDNNLKSKYIKATGEKITTDKYYTDMIKASEKVRRDIGLETDLYRMLDLSLLYIYFLTGDVAFYETNRNKLIEKVS